MSTRHGARIWSKAHYRFVGGQLIQVEAVPAVPSGDGGNGTSAMDVDSGFGASENNDALPAAAAASTETRAASSSAAGGAHTTDTPRDESESDSKRIHAVAFAALFRRTLHYRHSDLGRLCQATMRSRDGLDLSGIRQYLRRSLATIAGEGIIEAIRIQ